MNDRREIKILKLTDHKIVTKETRYKNGLIFMKSRIRIKKVIKNDRNN